ncbi:hypothetical protein HPB50_027926 [Hyalomma asiaticum]|nr:hypothetical protein HPB50_027926 [Hyalomma asiaticum]
MPHVMAETEYRDLSPRSDCQLELVDSTQEIIAEVVVQQGILRRPSSSGSVVPLQVSGLVPRSYGHPGMAHESELDALVEFKNHCGVSVTSGGLISEKGSSASSVVRELDVSITKRPSVHLSDAASQTKYCDAENEARSSGRHSTECVAFITGKSAGTYIASATSGEVAATKNRSSASSDGAQNSDIVRTGRDASPAIKEAICASLQVLSTAPECGTHPSRNTEITSSMIVDYHESIVVPRYGYHESNGTHDTTSSCISQFQDRKKGTTMLTPSGSAISRPSEPTSLKEHPCMSGVARTGGQRSLVGVAQVTVNAPATSTKSSTASVELVPRKDSGSVAAVEVRSSDSERRPSEHGSDKKGAICDELQMLSTAAAYGAHPSCEIETTTSMMVHYPEKSVVPTYSHRKSSDACHHTTSSISHSEVTAVTTTVSLSSGNIVRRSSDSASLTELHNTSKVARPNGRPSLIGATQVTVKVPATCATATASSEEAAAKYHISGSQVDVENSGIVEGVSGLTVDDKETLRARLQMLSPAPSCETEIMSRTVVDYREIVAPESTLLESYGMNGTTASCIATQYRVGATMSSSTGASRLPRKCSDTAVTFQETSEIEKYCDVGIGAAKSHTISQHSETALSLSSCSEIVTAEHKSTALAEMPGLGVARQQNSPASLVQHTTRRSSTPTAKLSYSRDVTEETALAKSANGHLSPSVPSVIEG